MRIRLSDQTLVKWLAAGVIAVLVIMPFHAALTVWLSSLVGHYTALRLWKEWLLWPLGFGAGYLAWRDKEIRRSVASSLAVRIIAAYVLVEIIWGIVARAAGAVSWQALLYGWISDTRYLLFFVIVLVVARAAPVLYREWPKLAFWPAAVVAVFGLLQYFVLPYDFLAHVGYSSATIFPYEDINHNIAYVRVMSTLRGANPLGAYLVAVLALVGAVFAHLKSWRPKGAWTRQLAWLGLVAVAGIGTLVLTFSRSAWIGAGLSAAFLAWNAVRNQRARSALLLGVAVMAVVAVAISFGLRNDTTFQNVFLHTQERSLVPTSSNEGHATALQQGLGDIARQPLGAGPGTAGPASVYNSGRPARIAENYFIQIAQETGLVGLGLFMAANGAVGWQLWRRRGNTLALGLLAGLVGISAIGLLSHVWVDDTLAYIWWGLAAVAIARPERGHEAV